MIKTQTELREELKDLFAIQSAATSILDDPKTQEIYDAARDDLLNVTHQIEKVLKELQELADSIHKR